MKRSAAFASGESGEYQGIGTARQMHALLHSGAELAWRGPEANSRPEEIGPLELGKRFWRFQVSAGVADERGQASIRIVYQSRHLARDRGDAMQDSMLVVRMHPPFLRHRQPEGISLQSRQVGHHLDVGVLDLRVEKCSREMMMVDGEMGAIPAHHGWNGCRFQFALEGIR